MSRRGFGPFQLDLVTGELWRDGAPVRLQPVLSKLLVELATRPGELVARRELIDRLWPRGTFVDYDNSLNNAIARLRRVIGAHRIQTMPQRGYRFYGKRMRSARAEPIPTS